MYQYEFASEDILSFNSFLYIIIQQNKAWWCIYHQTSQYKPHQIKKVKCFSSHFAGVFGQSIEAWAPSQYKDRLIYVWRFPC